MKTWLLVLCFGANCATNDVTTGMVEEKDCRAAVAEARQHKTEMRAICVSEDKTIILDSWSTIEEAKK